MAGSATGSESMIATGGYGFQAHPPSRDSLGRMARIAETIDEAAR